MRILPNSLLMAALGLSMLSGCATTTPPAEANASAEATAEATAAGPAKAAEQTPIAAQQAGPAVVLPNPAVVNFDKMSVTLDDGARQTIAQYVERAKSAHRVTAIGHCDRNQVANSPSAALRRAVIVRDELIRLGVDPANIHVKYSTHKPKAHMVEINFE